MKLIYTISGTVIHGSRRGRNLGYPTANVISNVTIPEGIYPSHVIIDNKTFIAATFVGPAITFGETDSKVESYILDFKKNIYGKQIIIKLYSKIRNNQQFESIQELQNQMEKDVMMIRQVFKDAS